MVSAPTAPETVRIETSTIDPARVLVLVPTLNEAAHIEVVLGDLMQGDPLAACCPIVVADGGSTDGTRDIVKTLARRHPNLRLLHNPGRTQAAAMNLLLAPEYADIAIAIRCDAHAAYPSGFVSGLAHCLMRKDAASVVIPMDAVADTDGCFQRGLVWITDTALGAGGAPHRGGVVSGYRVHGHHAAFRMSEFRRLSGYDTSFVANEDAEYDRRLTLGGGRIWLSAEHRIGYFPRTSARRLWRQYVNYGIGRAQTCLKHRIRPALRQLIPVAHTVLLIASLAALPFTRWALAWPLAYGALILGAGLWISLRHRSPCGMAATLALATMHLAWGLGFLGRLVAGRRPAPGSPLAGTGGRVARIAFFGHNVNDAAVRRRAIAFQRAGHEVVGFMPRRGAARDAEFRVVDLGETYDNAYGQRIMSIWRGARIAAKECALLESCDVIYARNLDMLAMAVRVSRQLKLTAPLIYECLDIHHRLVGPSLTARALRRVERALLRRCALVVISSPRFETEHFARHHPDAYRAILVENRMIEGDDFPDRPKGPARAPEGPLRIGWFGNLRCRRSFDLLLGLARRFPEDVALSLRGYPAPGVFDDLKAELASYPNITFGGRYRAPQDLAEIYGAVDLIWACDWYEAGANSVWLLPNRIYEGGYFGTPALAAAGTETARWLSDHGGGVVLKAPHDQSLEQAIAGLLADRDPLQTLRDCLLALPRGTFVEDSETTARMLADLAPIRPYQ